MKMKKRCMVAPLWALALGAAACDRLDAEAEASAPERHAEHHIADFDTIVTTESGRLGRVGSMAVAPDGRVWISDALNHRVFILDSDGNELGEIGREGAGPGEFRRPDGVAVSDSGAVIYDSGNRRVQRFGVNGEYRESALVEVVSFIPSSVNGRGDLSVPSMGFDGGLAQVVRADQDSTVPVGSARAPMPRAISQSRIREQAARKEIPWEFQNNVLPVLDPDGGMWLVIQAEGTVERFAPDGRMLWSRELPEGDVRAAFDKFFLIGNDPDLPVTIPWVARSGAEVGGDLWLMTDGPRTGSAILVLDGESGEIRTRFDLALDSPADAFAVDLERGLLFTSSREEPSLLRTPLPVTVQLAGSSAGGGVP